MKNPKVVIGIIVAVIVLALGGWLMTRSNSSYKVTSPDGEGTLQVQTENGQMSISDIMNRGGNVKCTYQATGSEFGSSDITMYISGKKMRVETLVTDSFGDKRQSTTVTDGEFAYMWSEDDGTGVKMPAPEDEDADTETWQGEAQYVDQNQKMDYKCDAWNVDESMFTPPANITFTDFTTIEASQCAMCDNLTGESKQTCLESLGCN